jgi:hypothetical protein
MSASPQLDRLERELADDLAATGDALADDSFSRELYRTITNARLSKRDFDGHVSLSWKRAEDLVNAVRRSAGLEPLALEHSGDEGEATARVEQALADLGWKRSDLNTSRHDDAHLDSARHPPPADTGERLAPVDPESARWEERAHEQADRERLRRNLG